jgi:hypothetical protein
MSGNTCFMHSLAVVLNNPGSSNRRTLSIGVHFAIKTTFSIISFERRTDRSYSAASVMSLSALSDSKLKPTADSLRAVLGLGRQHWDRLLADLHAVHDPLTEEWHFSGAAYGWSMRVRTKKRTLVYLIPREEFFLAGIVLGAKATESTRQSGLPERIMRVIDDAPVYAEGRGFRLEVRNPEDVCAVETLVSIKVRH